MLFSQSIGLLYSVRIPVTGNCIYYNRIEIINQWVSLSGYYNRWRSIMSKESWKKTGAVILGVLVGVGISLAFKQLGFG